MKELFARLAGNPFKTIELLIISLVANVLALASPVFVMLVLGRYVAYGIDATLITLSVGIVLALLMEFIFRQLRLRIAKQLNIQPEVNLSIGAFGMLTSCRTEELEKTPVQIRVQLQRNLELVSSAFNATNLCSILDVPFALLFIGALYLINPVLGIVATIFLAIVFPLRIIGQMLHKSHLQKLEEANSKSSQLFNNAIRSPDTVRLFDPSGQLLNNWSQVASKLTVARTKMVQAQGAIEILIATMQVLLGATIIAIGATYVVAGELNVSALIGANILAARALAPVSKFAQLTGTFNKATQALKNLRSMAAVMTEESSSAPNKPCNGELEFRDISFVYEGSPSPLIESLNAKLPKGAVLLIKGTNGAGKSTLMRLALGLLTPNRGQVFADGIDIRQLPSNWWRSQIAYMPQEPVFFDGTMRMNLQNAVPSADDASIQEAVIAAGLQTFVEENVDGLDMNITAGGANLALGIRKRFALARALLNKSQIALLDEPTEGLDAQGRKQILAAMKRFSKERRTIILVTDDQDLIRFVSHTLDLNTKNPPIFEKVGLTTQIAAVQK